MSVDEVPAHVTTSSPLAGMLESSVDDIKFVEEAMFADVKSAECITTLGKSVDVKSEDAKVGKFADHKSVDCATYCGKSLDAKSVDAKSVDIKSEETNSADASSVDKNIEPYDFRNFKSRLRKVLATSYACHSCCRPLQIL